MCVSVRKRKWKRSWKRCICLTWWCCLSVRVINIHHWNKCNVIKGDYVKKCIFIMESWLMYISTSIIYWGTHFISDSISPSLFSSLSLSLWRTHMAANQSLMKTPAETNMKTQNIQSMFYIKTWLSGSYLVCRNQTLGHDDLCRCASTLIDGFPKVSSNPGQSYALRETVIRIWVTFQPSGTFRSPFQSNNLKNDLPEKSAMVID